MRKQIGKRAIKPEEQQQKQKAVEFVENNTQSNLALRREHVYLEDVKMAMNINTLEQRILLRKHFLTLLEKQIPAERIKTLMTEANEKDLHLLIKRFNVRK